MKSIKLMLLSIVILLLTIVIHLFIEDSLGTDLIAIFGLIFALIGYFSNDEYSK